jgi:hypothetical protein
VNKICGAKVTIQRIERCDNHHFIVAPPMIPGMRKRGVEISAIKPVSLLLQPYTFQRLSVCTFNTWARNFYFLPVEIKNGNNGNNCRHENGPDHQN